MPSKPLLQSEFCNHDEPDWQPLYDLIGIKLADWFMWMCETELEDGVRVQSFKHITTREHLHLGADGRAFEYVPRHRYREIDRRHAIDLVFDKWDELTYGPHDDDRVALVRARQAAGPRPGARRRRRAPQPQPDADTEAA